MEQVGFTLYYFGCRVGSTSFLDELSGKGLGFEN